MKKFLTLLSIGLAIMAVSCKKESNSGNGNGTDPDSGKEVTIWANNGEDPQWSNDCESAEVASYVYTWYNADLIAQYEMNENYLGMFCISIYGWTEGEGTMECNYYRTFDLSDYTSADFTFDWCRYQYGPDDMDTVQAQAASGDFKTLTVPVTCPVIGEGQEPYDALVNCGKIDLTEFCGGKMTLRIHSYTKADGEAGTSYFKNFVLTGIKK